MRGVRVKTTKKAGGNFEFHPPFVISGIYYLTNSPCGVRRTLISLSPRSNSTS